MKPVGLFGGTFNPIHLGHLRAAQEVKEGFLLDKVYFIPSALPPHKEPGGVADANDRLEMIRPALTDAPDFLLSDVELKRSGPSFTVDTVSHFKSILPLNTPLYLIMGFDAFLEIDTWKSYQRLFQLIPFIVMARPGSGFNDSNAMEHKLKHFLKTRISDHYQFSTAQNSFVHPALKPIFFFKISLLDISSTKIRNLIKKGQSIRFLVPPGVEKVIITKGLYL